MRLRDVSVSSGWLLAFALSAAGQGVPAPIAEPVVQMALHGDQLRLSWPRTALGFELHSSGAPIGLEGWEKVEVPALEEGEDWVVFVPVGTASRFFRLTQPLHHVLVVGQSLAMGAFARDILSTNQPFGNRMFVGQRLDGGVPGLLPDDLSSLVPLRENWQASQSGGETIASGFANWISGQVGPNGYELLVSNCARGASGYSLLKREPPSAPQEEPTGTYPYLRGLRQVEAAQQLVGRAGFRFEAILAVHGESDTINPDYAVNIREWQADYEADIRRLTGQTNSIPMFHTQISAWGNLGNANQTLSPFKVLEEYERHPDRTVLVGPKYIFPHRPEDGLHLTSVGYRWLGEYYAKAYYRHIILGQPWSPLRPHPGATIRSNNVIQIRLLGAVGDLVLDTNLVANPYGTIIEDPNASPTFGPARLYIGPYGFEYWDTHGTGSPWTCSTFITNAMVVQPRTVQLFLNKAPQGTNRRIRYGYTALPRWQGGAGGPQKGPRGCLRDSDPAPSRYGHTLYNWCVHFDLPCP